MHRQNQISSGTDARTKSQGDGSTSSERAAKLSPGTVTVTQASSVRQTASVYHTATIYSEQEAVSQVSQNNTMSYATALVSKQTVLPPAGSIRAQPHDGAMSEQEELAEDVSSTGKKKKRKRGRRRKRKGENQYKL